MKDNKIIYTTANDKLGQAEQEDSKFFKSILSIFLVFVVLMFAIFLFYNVFFMKVQVSGPSMNNTLSNGDILLVDRGGKATYGDIIIISGESTSIDKSTGEPCLIIKRVIGLGGDRVKIKNGSVYLKKNNESEFTLLIEDYIKEQNSTKIYIDYTTLPINDERRGFLKDLGSDSGYLIQEGEIFYLGDNRGNSSDSRANGTCSTSQVVGVVCDWSLSLRGLNGFLGNIFSNISLLY